MLQTLTTDFRKPPTAPAALNTAPSQRYYGFLLAPAILLLAAISLYPFFWLIYMSLHQVSMSPNQPDVWVGLANYAKLFSDKRYLEGWQRLFFYSASCMVLQVGLGLLLALVLNNSRWEKPLVTVFLMPMMMAPVIAGLVWFYLYNGTFGWYNWVLQSLGILSGTSILGSTSTAMIGIVVVDTWQWTPLITLIVLAGLKRVPQDQIEAHMVDGAGAVRNFFAIVLPNLYPFLLIAVLLRFMDNFRFIDAILRLTGGGPANSTKVLPVYLFEVSFTNFNLGYGAAIAFTLLVVTIVIGMVLVSAFTQPSLQQKH
jgi:multiple sugar transport system permease protein